MAAVANSAAGAQLSTNTNQTAQGRLGIALALAAGQKFAAGTRQVAVVTFSIAANAPSGMTQIDFDDLPSAREVSDVSANALPASYQGGSISVVSGFEADVASLNRKGGIGRPNSSSPRKSLTCANGLHDRGGSGRPVLTAPGAFDTMPHRFFSALFFRFVIE